MSVMSMTGFARTDGASGSWRWHLEAKSVNGKSLDVRLRLPAGLEVLETDIRERAGRRFRRGNIQVTLDLERETPAFTVKVNEPLLIELASTAGRIATSVGAPPPSVDALLSIRGIVEVVEGADSDDEVEKRNAAILSSVDELFAALAASRAAEGSRIATALTGAVDRIEALNRAARDNPGRSAEAIRTRLAEQLAKLLDASPALDPDRLHQEALLLAVRSDVQEEIDRLGAHVESARDLMADSEAVGRKLDFLAQEFNREANTMCSKAIDREQSRIGLELKAVIDQFREQVQNVE